MTHRYHALSLALLGIAGLPAVSLAQGDACPASSPARAEELARQYAPLLSFAPGERAFPTIPFFPAFDGTDDATGFEITARLDSARAHDGRVSITALDAAYQHRVKEIHRHIAVSEPQASAVFYRVRCLEGKQPKQLWGFLRNDHVALKRTGLGSLYDTGLRDADFLVVEYYFYYVRDAGLKGHAHDIERIFVFMPYRLQGGENTIARRRAMDGGLRVVVGTGHSPTTPNNVLVLVDPHLEEHTNPSFLIELGGHSSAPDANRDNLFQVGLDINWNLSANVWGTRDFQAIAGRGFLGDYSAAMTFARGPCTATLLIPPEVDESMMTPSQRIMTPPNGPGITPCQAAANAQVEPEPVTYALLPVQPFARLASQAEHLPRAGTAADTAARIDTTRAAVQEIRDRLHKPPWGFQGFRDTTDRAVLATLDAVRNWNTVDGALHAQIWRHGDYTGSPIRVLKRRLYRPTARGLQNVGDYASLAYGAFSVHSGGGIEQLQLGTVVPAFGFIAVPGVVEVQAGAAWSDRLFNGTARPSVSVLYERHYRSLFSWYLKPLDFVSHRGDLEGRTDGRRAEFSLSAGISIMPFFPFPDMKVIGPLLSNRFRLRLGMRTDIAGWRPEVNRFEIQTILYAR